MTPADNWKRAERTACRKLGAERSGSVGKQGPDCDKDAPFATQIKRCARPSLKASWLEQAQHDAALDGRPWLLVQVFPNSPKQIATLDLDVLVEILRDADWLPWGKAA